MALDQHLKEVRDSLRRSEFVREIAMLEKRKGREAAALAAFTELVSTRSLHRIGALEELAKYYEHRERNYAMALEVTPTALQISDTIELRHGTGRLKRCLERPRPRRLFQARIIMKYADGNPLLESEKQPRLVSSRQGSRLAGGCIEGQVAPLPLDLDGSHAILEVPCVLVQLSHY